MQEYEAKLNAASREAEAVLIQAKERAQRLLDENEQRLAAEAERVKGEATREIDQERRKAIQEIRSQATDLALLVAEKVVERSLTMRIIADLLMRQLRRSRRIILVKGHSVQATEFSGLRISPSRLPI